MNENKILYSNKNEKLCSYIQTLYVAHFIISPIYCFVILTELSRSAI